LYDFLRNFHKRMEKLSYSFLIDYQVSAKTLLNNYGLSNVQGINIVYTLMCFILDKSLKDEECTLDDMSNFLATIIPGYYTKEIDEDGINEITRFIVYKVLRNDGKAFVFDTYDYISGDTVSFEYHLLQQRPAKANKDKSTFYLTSEGYRLLLGSLEVDEKTQIDINQMILEMSLKRKNFAQGLVAVENLNNLITSQINVINIFIIRTRENILSINQEDFEKNFIKNIEVLREQNKKFDELKEVINLEEKRLSVSLDTITEENYESLRQLGRIKEFLSSISQKAGNLINKHFEFKKEYINALEDISYYYSNKKIDIKEALLKPVEENALKLDNIHLLLNPLFTPRVRKHFNINKIFQEQRIYSSDLEEDEVTIDQVDTDELEEKRLKERKSQYKNIVSLILKFIIENKRTTFKDMIDYYDKKANDEYKNLVPSVRQLAEVIIELLRIGEIDIKTMIMEHEDSFVNEEIEFDLGRILFDEFSENYKFRSFNTLRFYKAIDIEKVEVKERKDTDNILEDVDFQTIEVVKCPNFIMEIE
jgi:hypothetical protein